MTDGQVYGFEQAARFLAGRSGQKVTRQKVYMWWSRHTRNNLGQPFPRGQDGAGATGQVRASRRWGEAELAAWHEPGVHRGPLYSAWRETG